GPFQRRGERCLGRGAEEWRGTSRANIRPATLGHSGSASRPTRLKRRRACPRRRKVPLDAAVAACAAGGWGFRLEVSDFSCPPIGPGVHSHLVRGGTPRLVSLPRGAPNW